MQVQRKNVKQSRDRSVTKEVVAQTYSSLSGDDNAKWHASTWYAKVISTRQNRITISEKEGRGERGGTPRKKHGKKQHSDFVLNERDRRTSGPR